MPFIINTENPQFLRVDAAYIAESGYQAKWDAIKNHPLGEQIGTRVIQEFGDAWVKIKVDLGWFERENLNAKSMNVRISGRMAQRIAANGQMGDDDSFDIPVEETDQVTMKRLKHMETYIVEWSVASGKPTAQQLKSITALPAWAIQEIIKEIDKGQVLLKDSPLPSK